MNSYELILFVISLFAIIEIILKFDNKEYLLTVCLYWVFVAVLICFAGLRTVGADLENYASIYKVLQSPNSWNDWTVVTLEPAFKLLFSLLKTTNFQTALFVTATIAVFLKATFLKKYSPYPILSLAIYFTSIFIIKEMGQIRHGVAMGIILWSFDALFQNNKKRFLILVVTAILFHWSAFCVLPLYFFANRTIPSYLYGIFLAVILAIVFLNLTAVIANIIDLVPIAGLEGRANMYLKGNGQFSEKIGINSTFILLIVVMAVMLIFRKKLTEKYPYFDNVINIYFLGIFYFGFFNSISEFAQRLTIYFRMIDMLVLPMIISVFRFEKILIGVLLCFNSFWTLKKYENSGIGKYFFPYESIINKKMK